jgi:hypothetical protein
MQLLAQCGWFACGLGTAVECLVSFALCTTVLAGSMAVATAALMTVHPGMPTQ